LGTPLTNTVALNTGGLFYSQIDLSELHLSYFCLTKIQEENMETTRLSKKGQIVIPKRVRAAHGWEAGLEFVIEDTGDGNKLEPMTPYLETKAEELLGCVGYKDPKKSLKEMEAAIAIR